MSRPVETERNRREWSSNSRRNKPSWRTNITGTTWPTITTRWRCPSTRAPTTYSKWTRSLRKVSATPYRKSWLILYHIVWEEVLRPYGPAGVSRFVSTSFMFSRRSRPRCGERRPGLCNNVPLVRRTCLGVVRWVDSLVMCFKHLFCCHNHTLYCNNILLKYTKTC